MNTKTTKQAIQFSDNASIQLTKIAREISELLEKTPNTTIEELKKKFGTEVGSIIASTVRESYLLGLHFMEQFAGQTVTLTPEATNEINLQIDEQIRRFWSQTQKIILEYNQKKNTPVFGAAGPADLSLFALFNSFYSKSAVSMSFLALDKGTTNTARQFFSENIPGIGNVSAQIVVPKFIWVSERDSRVCPICQNLDGRTWDVDDFSIPSPVIDTHFGCRCRKLPLDSGGKVYNA